MLNKAMIMGRLTRDPEMRQTASGVNMASFTVAVDRNYQKQGEPKQTDFIPVIAWRSTADFVGRYFRKGQMIVCVGMIQVRSWDDNEGKKRYTTEIVADEVYFGESKRSESGSDSYSVPMPEEPSDIAGFSTMAADEDLPF